MMETQNKAAGRLPGGFIGLFKGFIARVSLMPWCSRLAAPLSAPW
ncbi:MAG: hypothetical protein ACYC0Q_05305 [Eubacteriales bacterium]